MGILEKIFLLWDKKKQQYPKKEREVINDFIINLQGELHNELITESFKRESTIKYKKEQINAIISSEYINDSTKLTRIKKLLNEWEN